MSLTTVRGKCVLGGNGWETGTYRTYRPFRAPRRTAE